MAYRMTPARRAALRRAQAASARRRRGKGRGKLAAANRRATRNKRIAIAAAAGGLFGASMAMGYAGQNRKLKVSNAGLNKKLSESRSKYRSLKIQNAILRSQNTRYRKKRYTPPKPTKVYSQRVHSPQLALPRGRS